MTGSHADSIVHGGVYDGALGVIGAIAAMKGLRDAGFNPKRSIEVVQFTSEEGDRFSEVCFGRQVCQLPLCACLHCGEREQLLQIHQKALLDLMLQYSVQL